MCAAQYICSTRPRALYRRVIIPIYNVRKGNARRQKTGVRRQQGRRQEAEDRIQESEDRSQKGEGTGNRLQGTGEEQKSEVRSLKNNDEWLVTSDEGEGKRGSLNDEWQEQGTAKALSEQADVEGDAFLFVAEERHGLRRAFLHADSAAHAEFPASLYRRVIHRQGIEEASVHADATEIAELVVQRGDVARGSHHGDAVAGHGLDAAATALAAVADGVEAVLHRVLEPGRVQVPALVLGAQKVQSLSLGQASAAARIVFQDEVHAGLAHHHAHLGGMAGRGAGVPAGALVGRDVRRPLEHQVARRGVGDDLFEVAQRDVLRVGDDGFCLVVRQDLAVIVVGEPLPATRFEARNKAMDEHIDVLICPAAVYVTVQGVKP